MLLLGNYARRSCTSHMVLFPGRGPIRGTIFIPHPNRRFVTGYTSCRPGIGSQLERIAAIFDELGKTRDNEECIDSALAIGRLDSVSKPVDSRRCVAGSGDANRRIAVPAHGRLPLRENLGAERGAGTATDKTVAPVWSIAANTIRYHSRAGHHSRV
jgi:hypothetical protein